MQRWKHLILAGNRSFELGHVPKARSAYAEALFEAERLLADSPDIDDAIAAYVTTRHNLADLFDVIDEPERALEHLKAAHARLLRLLADADGASPCHLAARRHCHRTRTELLRFALSHGVEASFDPEPAATRPPATLHCFPGIALA